MCIPGAKRLWQAFAKLHLSVSAVYMGGLERLDILVMSLADE